MLLNLIDLYKKYDLKINGIIHIGAHFGHENSIYSKLGVEHRLFFEPIKKTFSELEKNVYCKNCVLVNKALGNENGKIIMNVESRNMGQSSSILKPKKHLEQYPHIVFESTEEVDMIKLDDYNGDTLLKYNFINIDVQGYELEVFKGSKKTLENIDYIMSEINRDEVYENCAKLNELIEFLTPYGFELVEQTWDGGTWGDGFFIKK